MSSKRPKNIRQHTVCVCVCVCVWISLMCRERVKKHKTSPIKPLKRKKWPKKHIKQFECVYLRLLMCVWFKVVTSGFSIPSYPLPDWPPPPLPSTLPATSFLSHSSGRPRPLPSSVCSDLLDDLHFCFVLPAWSDFFALSPSVLELIPFFPQQPWRMNIFAETSTHKLNQLKGQKNCFRMMRTMSCPSTKSTLPFDRVDAGAPFMIAVWRLSRRPPALSLLFLPLTDSLLFCGTQRSALFQKSIFLY